MLRLAQNGGVHGVHTKGKPFTLNLLLPRSDLLKTHRLWRKSPNAGPSKKDACQSCAVPKAQDMDAWG